MNPVALPLVGLNHTTIRIPWTKRGINAFYKENFGWYIAAIIPLVVALGLVMRDGGFGGEGRGIQLALVLISAWMAGRNLYRYRVAFRPRHGERIMNRNADLARLVLAQSADDPYAMSFIFGAVLNGDIKVYEGTVDDVNTSLRYYARTSLDQGDRCAKGHPNVCRHNNPGLYAWIDGAPIATETQGNPAW